MSIMWKSKWCNDFLIIPVEPGRQEYLWGVPYFSTNSQWKKRPVPFGVRLPEKKPRFFLTNGKHPWSLAIFARPSDDKKNQKSAGEFAWWHKRCSDWDHEHLDPRECCIFWHKKLDPKEGMRKVVCDKTRQDLFYSAQFYRTFRLKLQRQLNTVQLRNKRKKKNVTIN